MESDETRICNAAHLMVASLSGSLAHVTCKVEEYIFTIRSVIKTSDLSDVILMLWNFLIFSDFVIG